MKQEILSAFLCVVIIPTPILVFNADFAQGLLEWIELWGVVLIILLLLGMIGSSLLRLLGCSTRFGFWCGLYFGTFCMLTLAGSITSGKSGILAAMLPFVLVAVVPALRRSGLVSLPRLLVLVTGISVLSSLALEIWSRRADQPERQTIIIGLDGATWKIVDRLRAAGRLPTFDRLIAQGARGELDTLSPVISPPLWTSIATGKTPEHHGVKDFWTSSKQVRAKRLWEIVDEKGMTSGVLGYLVTWPPRKDVGFLIPGWLAQGDETVPADLSFLKTLEFQEKRGSHSSPIETLKYALPALQHGMTLSTMNRAVVTITARYFGASHERDSELDGRLLKLYLTADVFCHLLRESQPELGIYYYSSIDAIQHIRYKYYEPKLFPGVKPEEIAAFGESIPRIYEEVDAVMKRIIRAASPVANIIIVSDHGQKPVSTEQGEWFTINTSRILAASGVADHVRATNIGKSVFLRSVTPEQDLTQVLEVLRSVVSVPGGEPLFALDERTPYEAILTVSAGFELDQAVRVPNGEVQATQLVDYSGAISGEHSETAMLLMAGPDIVPGCFLSRGSILDVAPTVLALLGLPIARDFDGSVIRDAISPGRLAAEPITYVDTYGHPQETQDHSADESLNESILEKLKALGYVQ